MDEFTEEWLARLDLEALDGEELRRLLGPCGRSCAQAGVLPMYRALLERGGCADAFFALIASEIGDVDTEMVEPNRIYDVTYAKCLCPLHTEGPIHSAALCVCSRESLQFVMEQLFEQRRPKITLLSSVLGGAKECRLRVELSAEEEKPDKGVSR